MKNISLGQEWREIYNSEVTRAWSELSLTQKRGEFLARVETMFLESKARRDASKFEKFKTLWKKHSVARVATGVALAGGAMFALASGAAVVAGWILATRAVFSGIWGYIAADWAIDFGHNLISKNKMDKLLRAIDTANSMEELRPYTNSILAEVESRHLENEIAEATKRREKFQKSKLLASATVGAVMAILGSSSAAHAVEQGSSVVSKWVAEVASAHSPPSGAVKIPDMKTIFEDIRHDHPNQNYITLEQAVRRIEWLKAWISLDHSEQLTSMNSSISKMVANPDGVFAKNMQELGYLKSGETVDFAARRLTPEKIEAILEKTYGVASDNTVTSSVSETSSAVVSSWAESTVSTVTSSGADQVTAVVANPPVVPTTPVVPPENSHTAVKAGGLLVWISAIGYGIWKKFRKPPEVVSKIPPIVQPPSTPEIHGQTEVETEGQRTPRVPPPIIIDANGRVISLTPFAPAPERTTQPAINPINQVVAINIEDEVGMLFETRVTEFTDMKFVGDTPRGKKYDAKTIPGKFVLYLNTATKQTISFVFEWEEDGEPKFSERFTKPLPANPTPAKISEISDALLKEGYFAAFMQREFNKQLEAREVDTFELATRDLGKMIEQCETPASLAGKETGGFFFQSLYGIKNKTLRFYNLNNPRADEIEASGVDFAIKASKFNEYAIRGIETAEQYFPIKEGILLNEWNKFIDRLHKKNWWDQWITQWATGYLTTYNWHKHPGAPEWPSSMDISQWEWTRLDNSVLRQIVTWWIVNKIDCIPSRVPENMLIVNGNTFGKPYHYKITFWKLTKISPEENARRSTIIQEIGVNTAIRLGLCDNEGNPTRISRDIRVGRHTIKSDLQGVKIKTI